MDDIDILAISDVHWATDDSNMDDFNRFLDSYVREKRIENLVLIGDILDFWRKSRELCFFESLEMLANLDDLVKSGSVQNIHYVVGNHDCSLERIVGHSGLPFNFQEILRLRSGPNRFLFAHGHQLEWRQAMPVFRKVICPLFVGGGGGVLGRVVTGLWDTFDKQVRPYLKRRIKALRNIISRRKTPKTINQLDELVGVLHLNSLGPTQLGILSDYMMSSLQNRIAQPILGKELFAAERVILPREMDVELNFDKGLNPDGFYDQLFRPRKREWYGIGEMSKDQEWINANIIANIIAPFKGRRRNQKFAGKAWNVFELMDVALLLRDDILDSPKHGLSVNEILFRLSEPKLVKAAHKMGPNEFSLKAWEISDAEGIALVNDVAKQISSSLDITRRRAKSALDLKEDEFLIYGHTHQPFIGRSVANTGSWVNHPHRVPNTYVEIIDGVASPPMEYH